MTVSPGRKVRIPPDLRGLYGRPDGVSSAVMRRLKSQSSVVVDAIIASAPPSIDALAGFGIRNGSLSPSGEVVGSDILPDTGDLQAEVRWVVRVINENLDDVTRCLRVQNQFEIHYLLGNYAEAERVLQADDISPSLWAIGASLLLAEATGGLTANREVLAERIGSAVPGPFSRLAAYLYQAASKRAEANVSANRYIDDMVCETAFNEVESVPFRSWIRFILSPTITPTGEGIRHVVWLLGMLPAFDQYRFLLTLLRTAISPSAVRDTSGVARLPLAAILNMLARFPLDVRDHVLVQLLAPGSDLTESALPGEVISAFELYLDGSYELAIAASETLLKKWPGATELHVLHVKSHMFASRVPCNVFREGSPASQIYSAIAQLFERRHGFRAAAADLYKIALRLDHSAAALSIFGLLKYEDAVANMGARADWYYLGMKHPAPTLFRCMNRAGRSRFLDALARRRSGLASRLCAPEMLEDCGVATAASMRRTRHRARDLELAGDGRAAVDLYRKILQLGPPRTIHVACVRGLNRALLAVGDVPGAATLIADGLVDDPELFDEAAAVATCAAVSDSATVLSGDPLAWPLLVYATQYRRANPDWTSVFDAVDDALQACGVLRPSELLNLPEWTADARHRVRLVFFLRVVCTQEILDSSHEYASVTELEDERIRVCKGLFEIDPSDAATESYRFELSTIALSRFRRKAANRLRRSRIFVDKIALGRLLRARLVEPFLRYRAFSLLDRTLRDQVMVDARLVDADAKIIFYDASLLLFRELFASIRDAYVSSNEHGLDAYLSIRLRHGTLAAQLRHPLETEHLVTKREGPGVYAHNSYFWDGLVEEVQFDTAVGVDGCLARFSEAVDSLIEYVRSDRVRIRSEAHPDGMFDYHFTDAEIADVWLSALSTLTDSNDAQSSLAEFVSIVFSALDARTRTVLTRVRDYVVNDLSEAFLASLDRLRADFVAEDARLRGSAVDRAAVAARTAVANRLRHEVAEWFREPMAGSTESFSLIELSGVIEEIAGTQFPSVQLERRVTGHVVRFGGQWLPPLVDICHILLGNAAKHSALESAAASIAFAADGENVSVTVCNSVGPEVKFDELRAACILIDRMRSAPGDGDIVRREGGSGYAKLVKLLRHDLGCGDALQVSARATEAVPPLCNHEFVASVTIPLSQVAASDASSVEDPPDDI